MGKNESFVTLAKEISEIALGCDSIDQLFNSNFDDKMSVKEKLTEQTGVIGEKIEIGSFVKIESNFVGSYIHAGNKLATLVGLSESFEGCGEVAKNIAMQAAAMNPIAIDENGVSKEVIEKELTGYKVLNFLLKTFTSSVINWREDKVSAFDELALECIPKEYLNKDTDLYSSLLDVSCFIASLTDGLALEWYKKLS